MTVQDIVGHWASKDGRYHIWIREDIQRVQMYEERQSIVDEPLAFEYKLPQNEISISVSVVVIMLQPQDNSVFLKFNDKIVEFVKVY